MNDAETTPFSIAFDDLLLPRGLAGRLRARNQTRLRGPCGVSKLFVFLSSDGDGFRGWENARSRVLGWAGWAGLCSLHPALSLRKDAAEPIARRRPLGWVGSGLVGLGWAVPP